MIDHQVCATCEECPCTCIEYGPDNGALEREVSATVEGRIALLKESIDLACSEAACELLNLIDSSVEEYTSLVVEKDVSPIIRKAIEFALQALPAEPLADKIAAVVEKHKDIEISIGSRGVCSIELWSNNDFTYAEGDTLDKALDEALEIDDDG